METDRFQCYYCPKTFTLFSDIIDHLCRNHKHEIIKYREKELDDRTGRTGYRTKLYQDIIPSECSLSVTNDERLGITNEERSKKKKFNTLRKTTSDEHTTAMKQIPETNASSKSCLSEKLRQMEISAKNDDNDEYYEESDENDMEYIKRE